MVEVPPSAYSALMRRLAGRCTSVLDVGTGLMDSLATSPCRVKIGLDAHRPYLEHRRVADAVPVNADALSLRELFVADAVDLVTMIDVIEHFEKEDALDLLAQAEHVARRRVIVFTPRGPFPQADHDAFGLGGDELQRHRSTWDVEDFTSLGFRVAVLRSFHDARNESFVRAFGVGATPVDALLTWKNVCA